MKTNTLNIRHMDCMELMAELPNKSQHLIIVDPPYFEVKGGFDFIWASFEDYLKDVEKWAKEMKRVLADNGTLFWWGHAKKIAYSQIILDKYFNLENNLKWEKSQCQTKAQDFVQARTFAPVTEHLLFYSNGTEPEEWDRTGWDSVKLDVGNFKPLRDYFQGLQEFIPSSKKEMIQAIGQCADHAFRWGSSQWDMPTHDTYNKIKAVYQITSWDGFKEYEELRKEYEELRKEYEELRRPFNNDMKLTDVMKFSQESHETGKHNHPTQKPPTLCRALIRTCSKRGMNLLVPFMGSGTECVEGANLGLNVTASELDEDYYKAACERIHRETSQQTFEL